MLVNLVKVKTDRETKEETFSPLNINTDDIICLYKNKYGSFLVTNNGLTHKIKNSVDDLAIYLEE